MARTPLVTETLVDRAVQWIAPAWGLARRQSRVALAMSGGYVAGRRSRRATQGWSTSESSANSALLPDLAVIRDRSRDLVRNAPLAGGAVATVVTNVVGTGLKLRAQIDARRLGLDADRADEWERAAEAEFALWADSTDSDLTRAVAFAGFQDLALRAVLEAGDVFVALRWQERAGSPYALALQGIEGERVCNPNRRADTATLAGGVERDTSGAPLAYHIADRHPGDLRAGAIAWDRYPAYDDTGRRRILHLFKPGRFEASRGTPFLAPVVESLKQLDRYGDAELMAAVVNACFAIVTQTETGGPALGPLARHPASTTAGSTADDLKRADVDFEPGLVIDGMRPGEAIKGFEAGRPNDSFDPFVLAVLRQVGVALEIPYEVLIKHFTASYSAARAALLEAWKMFRTRRVWLAASLCQPVYEAFLAEAVARGRIRAPGFFRDAAIAKAWSGAQWVGPAPGAIDPLKEAQANELLVKMAVKTLDQVTAETTGEDWERVVRQRARERDIMKASGLDIEPTAGRIVTEPKQPVPADEGGGGAGSGSDEEKADAA